MRISIVDHVGSKAGMDLYSGGLAKGLSSNGANVQLFSNFNAIPNASANVKCFNIFPITKRNRIIMLANHLHGYLKILKSLLYKRNDAVITHIFSMNIMTFLNIAVLKLSLTSIIVIIHDVNSFKKNDIRFVGWIIVNIFANFLVVHNKHSKDQLLKKINIRKKNKIFVFKHGGNDLINQASNDFLSDNRLKKNKKYLLFFGQLKAVKGLGVLLDSLSKIPNDINLIIAGRDCDGELKKYKKLLESNQLKDRVHIFDRFITDDERDALFTQCDLIVLPYTEIFESGVLISVMSQGCPVLVSDIPVFKKMITHNYNGLVFESGNSDDLSCKIKEYFYMPKIRKTITKNARHFILENYNWNFIGKDYLSAIYK